MNKYIKRKKENKLIMKRLFTKEEQLFYRKFPRLFAICSSNLIHYSQISSAWKKVKKLKLITKNEFEIAYHTLIVASQERYIYSRGSRGEYYIRIFKRAGIKC